tara:strand:+ start:118 stop:279 length:162 start_codon:yes stop_codon:yes gene_type:complete
VIEVTKTPDDSPRRRKRRTLKIIRAKDSSETIQIMEVKFLMRSNIFTDYPLEE